jgi:enolase
MMMNDFKIRTVHAREIIDCRGLPTLEVEVQLENNVIGRAAVPAGRSTGTHEAFELRDGETRYHGMGVRKAVDNVNKVIAPALAGKDTTCQRDLDSFMRQDLDGTPDKSSLGANALIGVSLALARAGAAACGLPLYRYLNSNAYVIPVPLFNLINGGKHASGDLEIQEFAIFPTGAQNISHALQIATETMDELSKILIKKYGKFAVNYGDEGGFVPPMKGIKEPLDAIVEAVDRAGYSDLVVYGLDCAATHFYNPETRLYHLAGEKLTREQMIAMYLDLCKTYKLVSIEDALYEDDFEGWAQLTSVLGIQLVGDDLFTTNPERLLKGIRAGAANALLWKVNQIGTLTEAMDAAELAFRNGYAVQVSERSGETEDDIISDLTVALNAGQIKTGAPVRGERTSKYNRLIRIEEELGEGAVFGCRYSRLARL